MHSQTPTVLVALFPWLSINTLACYTKGEGTRSSHGVTPAC